MIRERWKWLITALCVFIILTVFYLSYQLLNRIRNEEEKKIQLWARAILKKSQILREAGKLFQEIEIEEKNKASLYARATGELANASRPQEINFLLYVIQNNRSVPVILTDSAENILASRNLDSLKSSDTAYLRQELAEMKKKYPPIRIRIYKNISQKLFYKDSRILSHSRTIMDTLVQSFLQDVVENTLQAEVLWLDKNGKIIAYNSQKNLQTLSDSTIQTIRQRLENENNPIRIKDLQGNDTYVYYASTSLIQYIRYFPYLFSAVFILVLLLTVFFYSSSYRLEQDRLWVGMSKETAHQLGTPISSLLGWLEYLGEKNIEPSILMAMKEDLLRLKKITHRFSKIGSKPELQMTDINELIKRFVNYIRHRISHNIQLHVELPEKNIQLPLSEELMEWVLENLVKNAVDAMEGKGNIYLKMEVLPESVKITIRDEGKGIPHSLRKKIFKPGFTTKSRGWGLGLSLSKRIVEEYHAGKLYLEPNAPGSGAVFCIELKM